MKKQDIAIFVVLVIFTCITMSGYLTEHFAADTFNIINMGYEEYAIRYSLTDGRILMGAIGLIAEKMEIPIVNFVVILSFLAIIVFVLNVCILNKIVLQYKELKSKKENILSILICYFTIFNYTIIENMYFVECFVMALSILFYMLAAYQINKNDKIKYLKALTLLCLGLISYQGTISAFFIFVLLFSILNFNNTKDIIKKFIISGVIFIIAFAIDNMCINIVEELFGTEQTRGTASNIIQILKNILTTIYYMHTLVIYNSRIFPAFLYTFFIIIISILVLLKITKQNKKQHNPQNITILLEQYAIIIFSIIFSLIPSIYSLSAFWGARLRFSMGATIGCIFIHLLVKTDTLKANKMIDKILIAIFIVYAIINTLNYVHLIRLNKWANQLDREEVYMIDDYINEYEDKNKTEVNNIKVVVIQGRNHKAFYPEMNSKYVGIAVSSIRTQWAAQGIINYYTNRNLESKDVTEEEKEQYLKKVDSEKGYLCMEDTFYISVYWY